MGKSLRVAYGEALVKLGQKNDKIVALDCRPCTRNNVSYIC